MLVCGYTTERTLVRSPALTEADRPLRVLLADDEMGVRVVLKRILERRGHHVTEAATVDDALALARESAFDVALVDIRMPGNGLDLARELEDRYGLGGRVVLMSGGLHDSSQGGPRAARFIAKPIDAADAVRTVEEVASARPRD